MITPEQLAEWFDQNLRIIKMQTQGLTHADCLLQPPVRGNCMNWVLGHIARYRNDVLLALGEELALDPAAAARYQNGSAPVTGEGEGVLPLQTLLAALEQAQAGIAVGLKRATPESLARKVQDGGQTFPLAQYLFGLYFHETYHVGQPELLRQLAGMDDQVI